MTISFFLLGLVWLFLFLTVAKTSVHMLQQNSYRNERYLRWMRKNRPRVFQKRLFLSFLPFLLAVFGAEVVSIYVAIIVFLLLYFFRTKSVEKLKLVFTARVKRLFTTITILAILLFAVAVTFYFNNSVTFALGVFAVVLVLPYYVVLIANTINLPIEKQINEYYFNDAKKIINQSKNLKVIGITGSFGKTSVKHFLHEVLATKYNVLMTPESYNTKLGVTITIRNQLKPYHDIFIAEMGAKQENDIREICELVHQEYGILTAIGEQHLETFKTLDNIKKTKYELIETLPSHGVGVLNKDDENITSYTPQNDGKRLYYGIDRDDVDVKGSNIQYHSRGTTFTVETKDGESETLTTSLLGKHNVYNILAAITLGIELGISLSEMKMAIKTLKPVQHRLELKKTRGNITIIDDAFNSNPVGAKMAIDVLGNMEEYKVLITPGMIELGEKEYELNKEFAEYAAKVCDYIILVGVKQTKPLQDGLVQSNYPKDQYYVAKDLNDALNKMNQVCTKKSVVLLENDLPDTFNE